MADKFSENFLWGAATSSHQVEGDNFYNDWWQWESSGRTALSGKACDHYHRFREDLDSARKLSHNAHRFSLEWSRLEKQEGKWDDKEWRHYGEVINEIILLGMEPVVTLNHFTLPLWFSKKGGWETENSVEYFSRFARKAYLEFGDRVRYWITINEPLVLAFIAYFKGDWPPGKRSFDRMLLVTGNMLKAHVSAYTDMKEAARTYWRSMIKPEIGVAKAVSAFHPCSRFSVLDRVSAHFRNMFQNHGFIKSAIEGRADFPPYLSGDLKAKDALDFIGLNYYFREFVHHKNPIRKNPFGWICSKAHHLDAGQRSEMGWEIYPQGIYEVIMNFSKYDLPIIITENGISVYDDNVRQGYIREHLRHMFRAIERGATVKGYFHWSLLDNFEWAEGYKQKFGLIAVDINSQKRKIRESAEYFSKVIKTGVL